MAFAHQLPAVSLADAAALPPFPFAEKNSFTPPPLGFGFAAASFSAAAFSAAILRPVGEYLSISLLLASSSSRNGQPVDARATARNAAARRSCMSRRSESEGPS